MRRCCPSVCLSVRLFVHLLPLLCSSSRGHRNDIISVLYVFPVNPPPPWNLCMCMLPSSQHHMFILTWKTYPLVKNYQSCEICGCNGAGLHMASINMPHIQVITSQTGHDKLKKTKQSRCVSLYTFLLSFGAASTSVFSFTSDKSSLLTMTERLPTRNENGGNVSDAREHLINDVFMTSKPSSP